MFVVLFKTIYLCMLSSASVSALSMKPRTAVDILMSARTTLPNPQSAHRRSVSHSTNHFASPFQPSGHPPSYGSALSWQQTTLEQSGMNMNHQDSLFSTVPLWLPLSPAVNELNDCPLCDLHMLSDLKPQDVTDLQWLSEDATRELPSSNITQFSHFSRNTQRPKLTQLKVVLGYLLSLVISHWPPNGRKSHFRPQDRRL